MIELKTIFTNTDDSKALEELDKYPNSESNTGDKIEPYLAALAGLLRRGNEIKTETLNKILNGAEKNNPDQYFYYQYFCTMIAHSSEATIVDRVSLLWQLLNKAPDFIPKIISTIIVSLADQFKATQEGKY